MDLLFELLFEIIIEGSLELGTCRKVPLLVRIIALILFIAFFGFIAAGLFLCGCNALQKHQIAGGILFIAIAVGLAAGCIYMIVKKFKENNSRQ